MTQHAHTTLYMSRHKGKADPPPEGKATRLPRPRGTKGKAERLPRVRPSRLPSALNITIKTREAD